ncbi:MAG TPA: hypothetical protein VJ767_03060 [Nitrososphaeraceae archaeon]|nr:hypothetical protein [Nitrososphaeraceae archaeon]
MNQNNKTRGDVGAIMHMRDDLCNDIKNFLADEQLENTLHTKVIHCGIVIDGIILI